MCNILFLPKGTSISVEPIRNMVLNNPDGYGLLVKDNDGTVQQIIKSFDPKGTNPDQVIHYLKSHKNQDRLLHVRFNTIGVSSLENTHPFVVSKHGNRTIYMMHNGTMYDFRPPADSDEHKDWSDSRYFAETFANKFFTSHVAKGDYHKGMTKLVLDKFITGTSKVVFWGSGLQPLFIGPWIFKKNDDGSIHYVTSNEDYFDKVNSTRSVQARVEASNRTFFQQNGKTSGNSGTLRRSAGIGYSGGNYTGYESYNPVKQYYGKAVKEVHEISEPEVGNSAKDFFTHKFDSHSNQRANHLQSGNVNSYARPKGESNTLSEIVSLGQLNRGKINLTEKIVEELKNLSAGIERLDPESLYDVEGFASLCHVTPEEWNGVVKKYPDSCGNLMLLLSYACAEMSENVATMAEKTHRQELQFEKMSNELKDLRGRVDVAA